jgi:DNA-binding NarL/FixJ family response regulator
MRVAIADDHEIFRMGFKALLQSLEEVEVAGEFCDGYELINALKAQDFDLIVIDQSMPGCTGLDVLRYLSDSQKSTKVIMLTAGATGAILKEALSLGANAIVSKRGSGEDLVLAFEAVQEGKLFVSAEYLTVIEKRNLLDELTSREMQILLLIVEGHSTRTISEQLDISYKTVDSHRTSIMGKLNTHSVAELMQFARASGLMVEF